MIGFFNSHANNIQGSVQGVYLMSSTSAGHIYDIKGFGTYIHQSNIRHCIALYSARVLSKHTWINDQDRYMGRENINE
jgi:hypothetical protein